MDCLSRFIYEGWQDAFPVSVGNNVLLSDNVKIDYSGKVVIRDNVWLSDNVHIHTLANNHAHVPYTDKEP